MRTVILALTLVAGSYRICPGQCYESSYSPPSCEITCWRPWGCWLPPFPEGSSCRPPCSKHEYRRLNAGCLRIVLFKQSHHNTGVIRVGNGKYSLRRENLFDVWFDIYQVGAHDDWIAIARCPN